MTLLQIIDTLKAIALTQHNIRTATDGDIYEALNGNLSVKYGAFHVNQTSHQTTENTDVYGLNLFFVDRLEDDDSNRLQIQSIGKTVLDNIVRAFCEQFDADIPTITYTPFTQRFTDMTAGVFATVTLTVFKEWSCAEGESFITPLTINNQDITITENGVYIPSEGFTGFGKVDIHIPVPVIKESVSLNLMAGETGVYRPEAPYDGVAEVVYEVEPQQGKILEVTENGSYTVVPDYGYGGMGFVEVNVNVPDLNGSYTEGYDAGHTEGYGTGFAVGYDEGVEEGTANAGAIIAETAQVMNITENGTYITKYSKPEDSGREITGYFDDGTPFYNYAQLNGKIFKTDIMLQTDSSVEIWWKPDFNFSGGYQGDGLFSTLESLYDFSISFRTISGVQEIRGKIGDTEKSVKHVVEDKWYHLILKESGLVMDGETITSHFNGAWINNKLLYLNTYYRSGSWGSANGYYGMIKIISNGVEYTIIPTENGFKNITTDTLLEVVTEGTYKYNGLPEFEGNLVRTVNVNIIPKLNIQKEGITFSYSKITEVPEWADWSNISDMSRMFFHSSLTEIPFIDTSLVTNMEHMCAYSNITTFPLLDTSKVTNMGNMFISSKLITLPLLDTSNVTDLNNFVYNCSNLTYFPPIDTSNATKLNSFFGGCGSLTSIPALNASKATTVSSFFGYSDQKQITDFGGLVGLKINWNDNYGLVRVPNLTYESCINVLNGLYDFTGNGETPTSAQGKLKVHANFLTAVGDEITIATNKGWTVTT